MEPNLAALCGAGGAIVPDVLKFINGRFGDAPDWVSKRHYWAGALLLVALGAVVAYLSGPERPIDALALGYAAPAVIAGLLGRKDGGAAQATINPPGATLDNLSRPDLPGPMRVSVPTFIRGIRSAWGTR